MSYTWGHSRGYTAEDSVSGPRVHHPAYWDKNYGPTPLDLRHNAVISGVIELPFGQGKPWAQQGVGAALLGGWQINALSRLSTGTPVTPIAPGTTLNAPGSGQFADCLGRSRRSASATTGGTARTSLTRTPSTRTSRASALAARTFCASRA